METVPRIFKRIRPAFRYQRSLDVLTAAREFGLVTKSNLILGMGETIEEVRTARLIGEVPIYDVVIGDGEGVIINIEGSGEKAEATIRFRDVGTKHLALAWAPLKKL